MFPSTSSGIFQLPPDPASSTAALKLLPTVKDINDPDPSIRASRMSNLMKMAVPKERPLEILPCANVQVASYTSCDKPGRMACASCRLVSYCSKECQKAHWKLHKQDCRNSLRSEGWIPTWEREGRTPMFINNETPAEAQERRKSDMLRQGISLWGNIPAIDVIKLEENEKDPTLDLGVAFIASGDLRHVIKTVNGLPSDFSGRLDILINDITTPIACRNLLLLIILGTIPDQTIAADIALHFWYSAFIPVEYRFQLVMALTTFMDQRETARLGARSSLRWFFPDDGTKYLLSYCTPEALSVDEAQLEYNRVRNAPSRRDYVDRLYAKLKPSHRVAFQEFRRFGIVLPFGAPNAHFNTPNPSLFSPQCDWLQKDFADPLEGWDIGEIIDAGKAHGAQGEDIYGCLYFFLTDQLRKFTRRLSEFPISFKLFNFEACQLAELIQNNALAEAGTPSTIRFDRIEVSNIVDANYVGVHRVISSWAPLLAQNTTAIILGYFMNWIAKQSDGLVREAGKDVLSRCTERLIALEKIEGKGFEYLMSQQYRLVANMDAVYDNSKPFSAYLEKEGLAELLRKTELKLRDRHTVVPHRLRAPLKASPDALPSFPDDASWYNYGSLSPYTWVERFVEFSR